MDDEEQKRALKAKSYQRRDEHGNQVVGVDLGLSGRTVERHKRCGNCQHFDSGERFEAHFNFCAVRDAKILRDKGLSDAGVQSHLAKLRQTIFAQAGMVGFCTKRLVRRDNQAGDDFTSCAYLCDTWSGAFGLKIGPEFGPVDKLPDEILDDRGEANPPRPGEGED